MSTVGIDAQDMPITGTLQSILGVGFGAVLLCAENGQLNMAQKTFLTVKEEELKSQNLTFLLLDSNHSNMIRPYLDSHSMLYKKSDLGDLLMFFNKQGDQLKLVSVRENPESKYDWVSVFIQFVKNNRLSEPDENQAWRYGQIVPETGEYMCRDCGYIEEFKLGQIFPVCEVCQSGDPDGPVDTSTGYWEKL